MKLPVEFKTGVNPSGLRQPIKDALPAINDVHKSLSDGLNAVVTSTIEGKHSVPRSAHYRGDAVDLRIWDVDPEEYAAKLEEVLGKDFVVVLESTHVHVHWSPIYQEERDPLNE